MLKLSVIMIGTKQPKALVHFYKEVLEKEPDMVEGSWAGWQLGSGFFSVGEHSEVKGKSVEPGRIMFNFESDNVKGEAKRISKIKGSSVVKEPYEMGGSWIATFADPDGNYFQLMSPWKS
jgi:predicted enzyme related to lactoylglutathione lyase